MHRLGHDQNMLHTAESARMPIAFDALCGCRQNVQF
jgi:hypothetical protein